MGINIYDEINTAYNDTRNGIISTRAGGFMLVLCLFIGTSIFLLIQSLFHINLSSIFIILISLPVTVFTYIVLFYKDKYLDYFSVFEMKPKSWKKKWCWISFGIVLIIFLLFFFSFKILEYSYHHDTSIS